MNKSKTQSVQNQSKEHIVLFSEQYNDGRTATIDNDEGLKKWIYYLGWFLLISVFVLLLGTGIQTRPEASTGAESQNEEVSKSQDKRNQSSKIIVLAENEHIDMPSYTEGHMEYKLSSDGTASIIRVDKSIPDSHVIDDLVVYNGLDYTVTGIGYKAFEGCNNLLTVNIPNTVKRIEDSAFRMCQRLQTVTIPESVDSINVISFILCFQLSKIVVSDQNPVYSSDEQGILYNKNMDTLEICPPGLTTFTIPGSVITINGYSFSNSIYLESVQIPNSVQTIGSGAFYNTGLVTVFIPSSVKTIINQAFAHCKKLERFIVDPGNQVFMSDDNGYLYNKAGTKILICPSTVSGKFSIPSHVTAIGSSAFYGCHNITEVYIHENVQSVEYAAFAYCGQMEKIEVSIDSQYLANDDRFAVYTKDFETLLAVPNTIRGTFVIKEQVQIIGMWAFGDCRFLDVIIVPVSTHTIRTYAFLYCTHVKRIEIRGNITTIGSLVFQECFKLDTLIYCGTSLTASTELFKDNNALQYVHVSNLYEQDMFSSKEVIKLNANSEGCPMIPTSEFTQVSYCNTGYSVIYVMQLMFTDII